LISNCISDYHLCAASDAHQCFPFYVYDADGSSRRENLTDWALAQFQEHYADESIGKWDIFYYAYAALHRPAWRASFAEALKRDLPRLPYLPDFWTFAKAGRALADLHVNYESLEPYPLEYRETPNKLLSYKVERKLALNKDKTILTINPTLKLAGIPPEAFDYKLGNRSALEWVLDQYQVKGDSDPNRADDERYIVKLIGQVIRVSVETVRIVAGLG
jgi:predicted helicase